MKLNQKGFSAVEVVIMVVIVGVLAAVGWFVFDRQKDKRTAKSPDTQTESTAQTQETPEQKEEQKQEPLTPSTPKKGTFGDKGDYGTFQAEGYATTKKVDEPFCEENCQEYDYVFFNITRIENTKVLDFINGMSGNSFVGEKSIGMGCIEDGIISYSNSSDSVSDSYTLTKADTTTIMAATAEKPVALEIERYEYNGGRGAPACYSHFATYEVLN